MHAIRVGDCWLKCLFLGNLFTSFLQELMHSTVSNSGGGQNQSVSDLTPLLGMFTKKKECGSKESSRLWGGALRDDPKRDGGWKQPFDL